MASTSITSVGGVTIVTQVIPKNDASIPLQDAADTTPQAQPPAAKIPPTPTKMDAMTATFLCGQPLGIGVVQIFIGLLCVAFALTAASSHILITSAPFGLAAAFVVSGSVAVVTGRRTSIRLVWASLVSSVVSVLLGLGGVAYVCWLLAGPAPSDLLCDPESFSGLQDDVRINCSGRMRVLNVVLFGLYGVLLVLSVLQVCVSVTICVFSIKAIRCCDVSGEDRSTLLSDAALQSQ
ncbi:membrane-spanning 4-domains subfamily A member 4A-like [Embiotoca jacksoni]|uniref:membrane-spanning 4-domains subfamily A member 4A-like n=1 Tax=Embiotoca jacksoni TaxID=100190 RepID=UPI00370431D5